MTALLTAVPECFDLGPGPPDRRTPVEFRPLAAGQAEPIDEVFDGLSARSRALRFLAPTPRLTGVMRRALSDVDHVRHVAWIARIDGRAIGLGSFVRHTDDPTTADVALAVADRHQRSGVGRALLRILSAAAARRGVRAFSFTVDPYNRAALALLRAAGAVAHYEDGVVQGHLPVDGVLAGR
jgi:ribosomal protein S18 acetylase RimI-like enzyme